MIGAALSYFQARPGEEATVEMMLDDIETVRGLAAAMPEGHRPIGAVLN